MNSLAKAFDETIIHITAAPDTFNFSIIGAIGPVGDYLRGKNFAKSSALCFSGIFTRAF
jgi:hypothetical protein